MRGDGPCYPRPVARLLLVGPSWPFRGGIARTTTFLARELANQGSLARFLTPWRQYPAWLYPGARDMDPDACQRLPEARQCFSVMEPWSWKAAVQAGRESAADVLVLPYWTWVWAPCAVTLMRTLRLPVLAIVHNPADHDASQMARWAAGRVLGRASAYLCHARSVAEQVRARFGDRPIAVHPLPPDDPPVADRAQARARFGLTDEILAVVCFGLIRPYKGVDVLLEAVASLPAGSPLMLLLAGEPWGAGAEVLRARLSRADLAGRVHARLEWIPEQEAAQWFAAADAAVLPYRSATGSAVAAQALGAGLPVVGTRVGGIAEVVEDGVSGLLVPPGDATALAGALQRLGEPGVRDGLAARARRAATRWTWGSYARSLAGLAGALHHIQEDGVRAARGYTDSRSGEAP